MKPLELIMELEGLRLDAYQDSAGIWTIGYGHIRGVHKGDTVSRRTAQALLDSDLINTESIIDHMLDAYATHENQYAALVSLAFNIGINAFKSSSVLRLHNDKQYHKAADAFLLWDKAHIDGELVVVQGLLNRREKEREVYLAVTPANIPETFD